MVGDVDRKIVKMDCLNKNIFPSAVIKDERTAQLLGFMFCSFPLKKVGDSTDNIWLDRA